MALSRIRTPTATPPRDRPRRDAISTPEIETRNSSVAIIDDDAAADAASDATSDGVKRRLKKAKENPLRLHRGQRLQAKRKKIRGCDDDDDDEDSRRSCQYDDDNDSNRFSQDGSNRRSQDGDYDNEDIDDIIERLKPEADQRPRSASPDIAARRWRTPVDAAALEKALQLEHSLRGTTSTVSSSSSSRASSSSSSLERLPVNSDVDASVIDEHRILYLGKKEKRLRKSKSKSKNKSKSDENGQTLNGIE